MKGIGPPEQQTDSQFRFSENYGCLESRLNLRNKADMLVHFYFWDLKNQMLKERKPKGY